VAAGLPIGAFTFSTWHQLVELQTSFTALPYKPVPANARAGVIPGVKLNAPFSTSVMIAPLRKSSMMALSHMVFSYPRSVKAT